MYPDPIRIHMYQRRLCVLVVALKVRYVSAGDRILPNVEHYVVVRVIAAVILENKLHTLEDLGHKSVVSRTGEVGLAREFI